MAEDMSRLYSIRMWAALSPLLALLMGMYFFNIIIPVIIYLCVKDTNPQSVPFIKRVMNFQISWMLWGTIGVIILTILGVLAVMLMAGMSNGGGPSVIGFLVLMLALCPLIIYGVAFLVFTILMLARANSRPEYVPPLTLGFFK